ncbi:MAG TPA: hypothetical protein VH186_05465 [Chloroflexia bacterium]|nr:hypothetical protein [Chloroflexia bacterium]
MIAHKSSIGRSNYINFILAVSVGLLGVALLAFISGGFTSHESSSSPSKTQTFRNPVFHYSLSFPAEWKVVDQGSAGVFSAASSTVFADEQQGGTNFSLRKLSGSATPPATAVNFNKVDVVAYPLETEMTAGEFLMAKSGIAPDGSINNIKVAGKDAIKVEVLRGQAGEVGAENLTYTTVYLTNGTIGYIIAGFGKPSVFSDILASFQLF